MALSLGLVFLAGLASFLSPCVLSLVPAYIGYLGGRTLAGQTAKEPSSKGMVLLHGTMFVLGFSTIFVLLGAAVTVLGNVLSAAREWLPRIGGVIIILFGLHLTGILRFSFLEYDLRPRTKGEQKRSLISSFLMGIFFSFGWSPCVGPILGSILTALATSGMTISQGIIYLSIYSAGLAIPFLVAAWGMGWVTTILHKYSKVMRYVEIAMGILLIIVGVVLGVGLINQLQFLGPGVNFGI